MRNYFFKWLLGFVHASKLDDETKIRVKRVYSIDPIILPGFQNNNNSTIKSR